VLFLVWDEASLGRSPRLATVFEVFLAATRQILS
jgi:hypothetical protein